MIPMLDSKTANSMSHRLAQRWVQEHRREAATSEWIQWMVQPFEIIYKHHRDFVYGPVDDAVDAIIKDLAPQLVKAIGEHEVDEDVDEFSDGALKGWWDVRKGLLADADSRQTEDWQEGYEWGYAHPEWSGRGLPSDVKRRVVEEALQDFRHRITEQVVAEALKKAWHAVSPAHTLKAIMTAVKKHGWKLGIAFALFELFEHMLLPTVLIALTGKHELAITGTLPIGEIIYAVAFRIIGAVPSQANEADPDGHLDWYEAKYGPVRIAALQ